MNNQKTITKGILRLTICLLGLSIQGYSQGFSGGYGGVGDDFAYSSTSLFNESYILSSTSSYSLEASAIGLIKLDSNGNLLWTKEFEGGTDFFAITWATKVKAHQNSVYFTGYTNDNTNAARDAIIVKVDTSGTVQWAKRMGELGNDRPYGFTFIGDFIYIAGYETQVGGNAHNRISLSKMDVNGNLFWTKLYGDDANLDFAMDVVSYQNKLYLTGFTNSFNTAMDGFVMCVDSSGVPVWSKLIESTGSDNFYSVEILNNTIIAVGETDFNANGGRDVVLVQLDLNGNLIQGKKIGSQYVDYGRTSTILNSKLYVSGWLNDPTGNGYILEIDSSLNLIQNKILGSTDGVEKLRELSNDGNYINLIGYSDASSLTSPGNGGIKKDPYLLRFLSINDISCDTATYTPFGTTSFDLSITSIVYTDTMVSLNFVNLNPIETSLTFLRNPNCTYQSSVGIESVEIQNNISIYPNPADNQITIKLVNDKTETVSVIFYNVIGKVVEKINLGNNSAITQQVEVSSFPRGVYFVSIQVGGSIEIKKIILK